MKEYKNKYNVRIKINKSGKEIIRKEREKK